MLGVRPEGGGVATAEAAPVSLDAVIGQARGVGVLRQCIASGRVHHAWIFSGPLGVGKMTAARAFAAELLAGSTPDPAQAAEAMALLHAGQHPDLHVITKELSLVSSNSATRSQKQSNIPLQVLREFMLDPASRSRVVQSGTPIGKVFIVDEAEMVDEDGQDTLLKLIEEPPEGTVIILVTSSEHRMLTTVRSRCQRVGFGTLTDNAMQQWLSARGLELPEAQRVWLMSYAGGSPGLLIAAIEHGLFGWHQALAPMLDALEAAPARANALGPAMSRCIDERTTEAVKSNKNASKEAANRLWGRRMIGFVADRIRRQMLSAARAGDGARAERLAKGLDSCAKAEGYLASNVAYASVMDNLAAQLMTVRR
ncbi:MAG: ATP-binding protein [bacterium]